MFWFLIIDAWPTIAKQFICSFLSARTTRAADGPESTVHEHLLPRMNLLLTMVAQGGFAQNLLREAFCINQLIAHLLWPCMAFDNIGTKVLFDVRPPGHHISADALLRHGLQHQRLAMIEQLMRDDHPVVCIPWAITHIDFFTRDALLHE